MKKIILPLILFLGFTARSQGGYEIKINIKGFKDDTTYLAKYTFDKQYIVDTCKKVVNGSMVFKGKRDLDKGVYFLVNKKKVRYFDFFINENTRFTINSDETDIVKNLKSPDSKENDDFLGYIRYITNKNKEFGELRGQTKGLSKADSVKFMTDKLKALNEGVQKFDAEFLASHKGTYIADVLNLKTEKDAKDVPKAKNGRPDSVYQYLYYKTHYWDGVNFKDDRLLRTPFFADRVKKYFEKIIIQMPDTIITEIDKVMNQCTPGSEINKFLLAYFTPTYETSKIMGFDRVFVHLIDAYIKTGRAKGVYEEATTVKIIERGEILKPLLLGNKAPDLLMIDTINAKKVNKMGFDTAKTSAAITKLYYDNAQKLTPLFTNLYDVKAKYTILVFWDVDCGHCQTEIPKLLETYHELRKTYDVKVFSVYTLHDFDKWRKYVIEKKLDFINIYDPVHLNNIKTKYDIFSTPVIYLLDKDKNIKAKRLAEDQLPGMIKMYESLEKK